MRKSGWAAATGIGSLVLLLAACGGSSGTTSAAGSAPAGSGSSGPAAPASSATAQATATKNGGSSTASAKATHSAAQPQASGGGVSFPPVGTTVMVVQHSSLGFVLAEANGSVVYTYAKDSKNGSPTCTGSCAAAWPPATGTPKAGPADTFPGSFGVVKGAGGVEQITYNGYPLYTFKGARPLSAAGNGIGGVWHVVPLSASDISGA